jgi:pimeloyl-ACP methyl ester carboxylesterase
VIFAPRPGQEAGWAQTDLEYIGHAIERLVADYKIDRARIVVGGAGTGGSVAFVTAAAQRPLVRGVVAIEAPPAGRIPENDPVYPLAIYSASAKKSPAAANIATGVERLKTARFPVTLRELTEADKPTDDDRAHLERWIDSLDRF